MCSSAASMSGFHLCGQLSLAYTADSRILVEHAYIVEVVESAEYARLRKLGDTRDKSEFQVWVEHLQRTVEVYLRFLPYSYALYVLRC